MFTGKEIMTGGVTGKNALTAAGGAMFLLSAAGITKVDRGEVGRVTRYGRTERERGLRKGRPYRKKILQPGWHVVMPFVGNVEKASIANTSSLIETVIRSQEGKQLDFKSKIDWRIENSRQALDIALFTYKTIDEYEQSVAGIYSDALQKVLMDKPEEIIRDATAVKKLLFEDNNYAEDFYQSHGVIVEDIRVQSAGESGEQINANALVTAAEIRGAATIAAAERVASALENLGIFGQKPLDGQSNPSEVFGRLIDMPHQTSAS
jgi:regulator of protease activity HflC (stomatin/prohibitin superfamily)